MTDTTPLPIDPMTARPGDIVRWSDGTTRVILTPGIISDGHGGTTTITEAIATSPETFTGFFDSTAAFNTITTQDPDEKD